ncbi:Hint domain-containing protein [Pseudoroseicyclus sp. H15]
MMQDHGGIYVISWAQIRVDGARAPSIANLRPGLPFGWSGHALRVDGPADILPLGPASGAEALRRRAALSVRGAPIEAEDDGSDEAEALIVTDGRRSWAGRLIASRPGRDPLLAFTGHVPPQTGELWIVRHRQAPGARPEARAGGVVCFTPGTMIRTDRGPMPVERLREGSRVQTKDNGFQPVLWLGHRRLTGARIAAMPWLAPVRLRPHALGDGVPDAGLTVSPDHRLLMKGARARRLFGEDEVLVAAADLVDDRLVLRERGRGDVTYIHLLLPAHEIVFANGVETESFHPATADKDSTGEGLHGMSVQLPTADDYGPYARRILSASEAAILASA